MALGLTEAFMGDFSFCGKLPRSHHIPRSVAAEMQGKFCCKAECMAKESRCVDVQSTARSVYFMEQAPS
jgi:hypothetical protein